MNSNPNTKDLGLLLAMIDKEMPRENWKPWPGGYPGEIEAALIDAVLSIRASYGSPQNGVRAAVGCYRNYIGGGEADDLMRLSKMNHDSMLDTLNRQVTSGRTKASAITEAAGNLVNAGVTRASDVDPLDPKQKEAYTSVHGLGWVTWEYFGMLLGKPGVKADQWIVRSTSRAVEKDLSSREARELVLAASKELKVSATTLDHALWAHERSRAADAIEAI